MLHLLDTASGKEKPAPRLPRRPGGRARVAQQRPRPRAVALLGALAGRRATRSTSRPASSSAGPRARRAGSTPRASRSRSSCAGRASTAARSRASSTSRGPRFAGPRPVIINIHGGPEGQSRPGFLGRGNYLHGRARRRRDLPERARLDGLRQDLPEARQRRAARGLRQGHRRAARLDRDAPGSRRRARDGHGRQLRRLHDAGGGHALRRPAPLRARRRRDLELRHLPGEHRGLPARPAARRVRRRARPRDAEHLVADLAR